MPASESGRLFRVSKKPETEQNEGSSYAWNTTAPEVKNAGLKDWPASEWRRSGPLERALSSIEIGGNVKVKPLQDRILVERIEEEIKKGGIIIPDSAKEKPQQGKVIAVGPGRIDDNGKRIPMEVKKGDYILFGKYSGNEIRVGDDEHLIMREEDVLAVIDKD
jgi:chaperonin GroES